MTGNNAGNAGNRHARHAHTGRGKMRQIPDAGRVRRQMRVVGENRLAVERSLARNDPIIAHRVEFLINTGSFERRFSDLLILQSKFRQRIIN